MKQFLHILDTVFLIVYGGTVVAIVLIRGFFSAPPCEETE